MNPLLRLKEQGQSVWMDYIRRDFVEGGELARLIAEDGLCGLTSNPKIFMTAMTEGDAYDDQIREILERSPSVDTKALYEELALLDVIKAADELRPVHEATNGRDGFVSLEVSPHLARDTEGSIDEARWLWQRVDRPNVMIKVPATAEGIPAIETLLSEGINVNITLMFSSKHYDWVTGAHLAALQRKQTPSVASVASFFVSRIDSKVDGRLDEIGTNVARSLKGKTAIALAKRVYQRYIEIYGTGGREMPQRKAQPQRVLWGSTSTKNPEYSDVLYVEALIGRETINTMPPETMDAFRDHGRVQGQTVLDGVSAAEADLRSLAEVGIDIDEVGDELQEEGIRKFAEPFDELLGALEHKRKDILQD